MYITTWTEKRDTVFCYYAHNSVWTCELSYGADTMFHRTYFLFKNILVCIISLRAAAKKIWNIYFGIWLSGWRVVYCLFLVRIWLDGNVKNVKTLSGWHDLYGDNLYLLDLLMVSYVIFSGHLDWHFKLVRMRSCILLSESLPKKINAISLMSPVMDEEKWCQATDWGSVYGLHLLLCHYRLGDRKDIWPVKTVPVIEKILFWSRWRKKTTDNWLNQVLVENEY